MGNTSSWEANLRELFLDKDFEPVPWFLFAFWFSKENKSLNKGPFTFVLLPKQGSFALKRDQEIFFSSKPPQSEI